MADPEDFTLPKYQVIKNYIRTRSEIENWTENHRLPSEFDLMDQFQVSRNTVRQALSELQQEGLLKRERGRGTYYSGTGGETADTQFIIGITTSLSTYIYPSIVQGAEQVLTEAGYHIVLGQSAVKENGPSRFTMDGVAPWKPDGHLFEPLNADLPIEETGVLDTLKSTGIPFVLVNWQVEDPEISYVSPDDFAAGKKVFHYLRSLGHRRIAFIGHKDHSPSLMRFTGFSESARTHGERVDDSLVRWLERETEAATLANAYDVTRALLRSGGSRPTAIFYYNDRTAAEGYRAARDGSLSIPRDVSIVGFDDSDMGRTLYPRLTTLEHPKSKLGRLAAQLLLERIADPAGYLPKHILFPCRFIERDSVRNLL